MSCQRLFASFSLLIGVSGCSQIAAPTAPIFRTELDVIEAAKSESQRQALARAELESQNLAKHLAKLRMVSSSDVLGLTEKQVVEKLGLDCLQSGQDGERWFSSGIVVNPPLGGYILEKHHILTFADGIVIKYDTTNVITACIIMAPFQPEKIMRPTD